MGVRENVCVREDRHQNKLFPLVPFCARLRQWSLAVQARLPDLLIDKRHLVRICMVHTHSPQSITHEGMVRLAFNGECGITIAPSEFSQTSSSDAGMPPSRSPSAARPQPLAPPMAASFVN